MVVETSPSSLSRANEAETRFVGLQNGEASINFQIDVEQSTILSPAASISLARFWCS